MQYLLTDWIKLYARKGSITRSFTHFPLQFQKEPPVMFYQKAVLQYFAIFTGNHLCWSIFLIKLQALNACYFIKKRLLHKCFPVNTANFLKTSILKSICERLLLQFLFEMRFSTAILSKSFEKLRLCFPDYVLKECFCLKF